MKGIQIGKEIKLSLFADHMVIFVENKQRTYKKKKTLLDEFSEFRKVKVHKINTKINYISVY